jgi:phage repressor protein C with HTH and peptisase S24 domain
VGLAGGPRRRRIPGQSGQDFTARVREIGGKAFLESLEDSLSNFLRISDREAIIVGNFQDALNRIYQEHVEPRVHRLPLYSLQAAAGKFGEDTEVEAIGFVNAPPGLRLTEGMFAARVVGRSMEPVIPDGSLCVFRAPVVGSRQGKRLLIEQFGATDTSARYTVKRYTSTKTKTGEDEWRHASVRLEPLNPAFEAFELGPDDFRVIAEFIQVLE